MTNLVEVEHYAILNKGESTLTGSPQNRAAQQVIFTQHTLYTAED